MEHAARTLAGGVAAASQRSPDALVERRARHERPVAVLLHGWMGDRCEMEPIQEKIPLFPI